MAVQHVSLPLVLSILPSLCIVAVGLRLYMRWIWHLDLRLDDWLTVPVLVNTRLPQPRFRFITKPCFMIDSYTGNLLELPSKDTTVKLSKKHFSTDDRTVAFQPTQF